MKNLVSIIIPCYNEDKYIEYAISSASKQTYSLKELIVVDDGSNKKTKDILDNLKGNIDVLITQENQGVVRARNNAIEIAKGEFILTLDADDYFELDFLDKAVNILNKFPEVGLVTCTTKIIDDKNRHTTQTPSGNGLLSDKKVIHYNNAFASALYRKKCWDDVNGYDENMNLGFEDWEFNISIAAKGWKVHVIKEQLFNYRNRRGSRNKTIGIENNINLVKYIYKKHRKLYIDNYDDTIDLLLEKLKQARLSNVKKKKSGSSLIKLFKKD